MLAAVEASTAANTKAAYRSNWSRFTLWAGAGGVRRIRTTPPVLRSPLLLNEVRTLMVHLSGPHLAVAGEGGR